jgi:predicted DNA-binding transcriptional regulator YafY
MSMSMNERIYQIDQLLNGKRSVTFQEMTDRLEVSRATLKRDLAYMRDRLNAPIIFDKELGGYRFEKQGPGTQYELPGLWFTAEEIHALLTMQHLLGGLDTGGLLGPHIKPLLSRLTAILGTKDDSIEELQKRVKFETVGNRHFKLDHFQALGSALLRRKRLTIDYLARSVNEFTTREISPQRLVYYRENWYLDAWCHTKKDIRSFSIDSIKKAEILEKKSENISEKKLNDVLGSGYGIFSGSDIRWATLRFTPERAKWVASEKWHPEQKNRFLKDGSYELKIPYTLEHELIMDIMKYGQDVIVTEPADLKRTIQIKHQQAADIYNEQSTLKI